MVELPVGPRREELVKRAYRRAMEPLRELARARRVDTDLLRDSRSPDDLELAYELCLRGLISDELLKAIDALIDAYGVYIRDRASLRSIAERDARPELAVDQVLNFVRLADRVAERVRLHLGRTGATQEAGSA